VFIYKRLGYDGGASIELLSLV